MQRKGLECDSSGGVSRCIDETIRVEDVFAELTESRGSVEASQGQILEGAGGGREIATEGDQVEGNFSGLALGRGADEGLSLGESGGIEPEFFADFAGSGGRATGGFSPADCLTGSWHNILLYGRIYG